MDWHETTLTVRYAETDQMGIVHHANYLVWLELGRTEFCKAKGFSYREMETDHGALMVVAEVYCRYKSPAFYDDVIIIRTKIEEVRSRTLRFLYEVFRPSDNALLMEAETMHIMTDTNKKVRSIPDKYKELLSLPFEDPGKNIIPEEAPH